MLLIDADNGIVVERYDCPPDARRNSDCSGARFLITAAVTGGNPTSSIETDTGGVVAAFESTLGLTSSEPATTRFNCHRIDIVNSGIPVVEDRAIISWSVDKMCDQGNVPPLYSSLLINTTTGAAVDTSTASRGQFNCAVSDRLIVN
jgi:hypothetical protein